MTIEDFIVYFVLGALITAVGIIAFFTGAWVISLLLTPGAWFAIGGWLGFGAGIIGGIWYFF